MPTLSESRSREIVRAAGVAVSEFVTASSADEAVSAAADLTYPLVAKLCGDRIAHKTERGLIRLRIADSAALSVACDELLAAATPEDGEVEVLISTMVDGNRELIAGLATDEQFGPTVMIGVGGILAEAIEDVVFRLAPLSDFDADDMVEHLSSQKLLDEFRGEPAVDRASLRSTLVALGTLVDTNPEIVSVDLNPLIVVDGVPVAVDALVEVRS
ncbi:MAG: acetate--CoA ligase family protein [Acidobacteria bacterium]|nr:acetate--CoA ligase family protein [Acidobacteriota bacterium]